MTEPVDDSAIISKAGAQYRVDRIHHFQRELESIEAEGIATLDSSQRESIGAYHAGLKEKLLTQFDVDLDGRNKQLSLGMQIASFLGALALAASAFFLFYRFWGDSVHPLQIRTYSALSSTTKL